MVLVELGNDFFIFLGSWLVTSIQSADLPVRVAGIYDFGSLNKYATYGH